jgi:hypothetical protein
MSGMLDPPDTFSHHAKVPARTGITMKTKNRLAYFARCAAAGLLLSGCGAATVKMYDGPERAEREQTVLSSVDRQNDQVLSLSVTAINDVKVDSQTAAEFLLVPGQYRVRVKAVHDKKMEIAYAYGHQPGVNSSWKEAEVTVLLNAMAGKTYIPEGRIEHGKIMIVMRDFGESYPRDCMPLRMQSGLSAGMNKEKQTRCPGPLAQG